MCVRTNVWEEDTASIFRREKYDEPDVESVRKERQNLGYRRTSNRSPTFPRLIPFSSSTFLVPVLEVLPQP